MQYYATKIAVCLIAWAALVMPAHAGPALLFEPATGKVLYEENMDQPWHPASLTKIMTAYLVFKDIKAGKFTLKSKIPNSKLAQKQPPSKLGLPIGATLLLDTALKALLVKSANDVAVMLAEAMGGSHDIFIARMNATAKRLGMTNTNFVNPNGLPEKAQVTSARDLAKLTRAVIAEFPEHAHYFKMSSFKLGKLFLRSHNALLRRFDGADGMKTGFICDSGFNVVASATRDGRRLVAIVLGEPTAPERNIRAASILEYGFRQYGWKTFFNSATIDNLPVKPSTGPVQSVRNTVASYSCGNSAAIKRKQRAAIKAREAHRARRAAAQAAASSIGNTPTASARAQN